MNLDLLRSFFAISEFGSLSKAAEQLHVSQSTLTRQVQSAADQAKGCVARLAGHTPEVMEDNETTFAELHARIKKVIGIVESYKPEQLEGSETREIVIKIPSSDLKFSGLDYVESWVMPNFYFHLTMAYAILRHNGIELGKRDFLMS